MHIDNSIVVTVSDGADNAEKVTVFVIFLVPAMDFAYKRVIQEEMFISFFYQEINTGTWKRLVQSFGKGC